MFCYMQSLLSTPPKGEGTNPSIFTPGTQVSRLFKKTNAHRLLVSPGSAVKSPYVPAVCTAQGGGADAVCAVTPCHCSMLGALGRVGRDNLKPAANGRYLV